MQDDVGEMRVAKPRLRGSSCVVTLDRCCDVLGSGCPDLRDGPGYKGLGTSITCMDWRAEMPLDFGKVGEECR